MTVEVDRDVLLTAVRHVSDVVEARNTIPILSNVLLQMGDGVGVLTGTDLDVQIRAEFEAAGSLVTTVAAAKLLAAAQSFKAGMIRIEPNEGGSAVTMRQARSVRTLPTLPAADFPDLREKKDEVGAAFAVGGKVLSRLLDTTQVAQSSEETRYYLNGVFLHVADEHLRAAATDGHRMVRAQTALPPGAAAMRDVIVPRKTVGILRKLLSKADLSLGVEIGAGRIAVTIGKVRIDSKLVEGSFPDYQRVIPPDGGHLWTVGRAALVDGIASVSAIVSPEGEKFKVRSIRADLASGDDQSLFARDMTGTNASESVAGTWSGPTMSIGANAQYLAQIAGIFAEAAVLDVAITDPKGPIRITSAADPDLVAVCMPMRV